MAPRLSLPPSFICSVTTVSFSLMMGRMPQSRRVLMVFRALRYQPAVGQVFPGEQQLGHMVSQGLEGLFIGIILMAFYYTFMSNFL